MLSEHPFFLSKIQKLSIRWGKKSNQPTNKPFLRVGFLRVTLHNYDVLGAVAQIPIILTGSKVSLLNLEMEMLYLFSSLVIVSLESVYNLFVFLSRCKCKIYTGVTIIWYFFQCQYILICLPYLHYCTIYTMLPVSIYFDTWHSHIFHWPTSSACKAPTNKAWNTMLIWLKYINLQIYCNQHIMFTCVNGTANNTPPSM